MAAEEVETGPRASDLAHSLIFLVLVAVGVTVTVFGNELRAQDFDPQYARDVVERTLAYGGSFYENGIHNKGPFEMLVYQSASWITSYDGFWYAISAFVTTVTLVLGWAASRAARFAGGNREAGLASAVVVFVHFALSGADYAGVLYARNMVVAMLAVAWVVAIDDRPWTTRRRSTLAALAFGVLVGLAVQTLTPAVFAGVVLSLVALACTSARFDAAETRRLTILAAAAGSVTFFSAHVWYALRGAWTEFWSGWWTHARYMNIGTGRSLGSQLGLGWDQLYEYYRLRPLALGIVVVFGVVTAYGWEEGDRRWRALHAGLLGWWAAAWLELVLSQRYSSHYFSVTSVPTALMGAALAGHAVRALRGQVRFVRSAAVWPVVAAVLAVYLSGPQYLRDGWRAARDFRSVEEHAADVERYTYDGTARAVYAVLDLVSEDGDPLLAWTNNPWPYLKWHRVSATRFIWKSFLLGEIYLGRTSTDYVLHDTWEWFREDLEESDPVAFVEEGSQVQPGTPFAEYVEREFALVYPGPRIPVYLRRDVASEVLTPSAGVAWVDPGGRVPESGWTVADGRARYAAGTVAADADRLRIASGSCFRLDGTITSDAGPPGSVVFLFEDNAGREERVRMALEGDKVVSASDFVTFEEVPAEVSGGAQPFSVVVGRRSAVFVIDGQVRAAVRLPGPVTVSAVAHSTSLVLDDLRTGDAPAGGGC